MTNISSSDVIAIAAAFTGLTAVGGTLWQGWLTRQHNRLIVRPHLIWHRDLTVERNGHSVVFSIQKKGVGPAIVTDRFFTFDGRRFAPKDLRTSDIEEIAKDVFAPDVTYTLAQHGLPGIMSAILPNDKQIVAHLHFPGISEVGFEPISHRLDPVNFEIKYTSLYGETFSLSTA